MNLLVAIAIFCSVDVYFLKDSPDLLVRVVPEVQTESVTIYYSFWGTQWDSTRVEKQGRFFDAVLRAPDMPRIVGIYCVYDDYVDDNNGDLYLYELKIFPRMLMPFSLADLKTIVGQARKKILARIHIDEAITLLDYADNMLAAVPYVKNSPNELSRNTLEIEVHKLRGQIVR